MKNEIALLNHIGIDQNGDPHEILMELMNFTLQSMGAIRILVQQEEIKRLSKVVCEINNPASIVKEGQNAKTLRETFASAVSTIADVIVNGKEINDLNPARHLIESFPSTNSIGTKHWLALQWAIIHDNQILTQTTSDIDTTSTLNQFSEKSRFYKLSVAYPELRGELDKEGRSLLHIASRLDSVPLVQSVIDVSHPPHGRGIDFANFNGALPVHNAARFCQSLDVFNLTADISQSAIEQANNEGVLPLHWAAAKNTNTAIISSILQRNPVAITRANNEGYLPLHCSGQNVCLDVVQVVYSAFPEAIKYTDNEGGFPLHHACYFNSSVQVVQFFYEAYPQAMSIPQENGTYPLHLAAAQNASVAVMKFILEVTPSTVFYVDAEEWLPIHCLLDTEPINMTAARLDCLNLLLRANPKAVVRAPTIQHSAVYSSDGEDDVSLSSFPDSAVGSAVSQVSVAEGRNPAVSAKVVPTPYQVAAKRGHGDKILRAVLNANPVQNVSVCGDLNWKARKWAVLFCLFSLQQDPPQPTVAVTAECGDKRQQDKGQQDLSRENVLRLLSYKYIEQTSRVIPAGVLRKIIRFL